MSSLSRREFLFAGASVAFARPSDPADITIRISEITLELSRKKTLRTIAYNGQVPGPLLKMTEGRQVTVDVINETNDPDMVHWHGFHIPAEVDGAHEEGTPMVMGHDRRRYVFTPGPVGTRWYHSHAIAGFDLKKGTYSGQFGMVVIESKSEPGGYDLDTPIVLHDWEPYFSPEKDGDINYRSFSVNGKMLGAGEPVRVKSNQRVLFRVLNASATLKHRLALPHHVFQVIALDGNPVANRKSVAVLELSPGERVDAIVEMKTPGVWILGEEDATQRQAGAGIVVEYAQARGPVQWNAPPASPWDYTAFGEAKETRSVESTIPLVFENQHNGHLYSINGKSFPDTDPIRLRSGSRHRLVFENRSNEEHPMHLHRHTFEIVRFAGKPTAGVLKDVVAVPAKQVVEVELVADQPGPSLFHCHQQFHMDFGFMALAQCK